MTQFLDTPVDKSLSTYDTWIDIDLSNDVPEGATGAIFRAYNSHTGRLRYALRKNGSSDNRYYYLEAGGQQYAIIGLDENRKCEGMADWSSIDFFLVGYTEADATFFTNGVNKSISAIDTWTDMDLSGNLPAGSVAAIFEVVNIAPAWVREYGLRKNGSSDNRHPLIPGGDRTFMVVGVDENRKCEGYIDATELDFYLIGYLTMGQAETNAHNRSLGSGGSYIDIDESGDAPSTATGIFGEIIVNDMFKSFAARKNGTSFDYYKKSIRHEFLTAGLDSSKKWEGKISATSVDYYTMGYFVSAVDVKTKTSSVGLRVVDRKAKASSVGLSVSTTGTHFLDTPIDKSLSALNAWTDIDVSANVSPGASGAIFQIINTDAGNDRKYGIRKNGSTDDRFYNINPDTSLYAIIGIDANGKCQAKIDSISVDYFLIGYTKEDATFFTNAHDKSQTTLEAWTDLDLSSELPAGAVTAIFQIVNTDTLFKKFGLRKKGSTDDRYGDMGGLQHDFFMVGVDVNRECQFKIETTDIDFYLVGYLTRGSSEINGIDQSLSTTGSYIDITESEAPGGSTGVFVQCYTADISKKYAARKKDITWDKYYLPQSCNTMLLVGLDEYKKWEGKIESTVTDFYTLGYFAGGVITNTKASSVGVSVQETKTKASSVGVSVQETKTKASSIGLTVQETKTKASSIGLTVQETKTKPSSIGMSVKTEEERVSILGITIVNRFSKQSSIGISITGTNTKESSAGLSIMEQTVKASSVGLSIIEQKVKASSVGMEVVTRETKASSVSLTVFDTPVKNSSIGLYVTALGTKESSIGMAISGHNTKESSIGLRIDEPALKKGLFYAKLGDTILEAIDPESFRISEEINKIPSFEFEVANSEVNKTAIATNPTALFRIYWQHHGLDTHIFTGIINADGIEYVSLTNIRITGFSSYVKLGWPLFKHLNTEDAEPVNTVFDFHGTYTDYTTQANNANINDVIATFEGADQCFYVGEANPFWGLQVKYSTKGVPDNAVTIIEYSKGSGIWAELNVLDETYAFTEPAGTYDIIIAHPPSDWARNTVDGTSKFWIRWRVVSGAYTTSPKLDQIHTVNVDVYRVFYLATSARAILLDTLEDTDYSMDPTDACPEDEINLFAEYESPLRVIAAIPAALTWTDTDGSKKSYQWWIDEAKKVHIKQKRGTTHSDDITGDLTIFNNLLDYFNVSNRLIGFAKRDGLSQIRAIVENTASQTTHTLRELAVPKTNVGKYITLKESLEKDIAISKDPMQRIKGSVTTEFWGKREYEVGDTVTLHQGEWVVEEGEFQIVKVDKGPILTQLNLGISREHLEGLKSNLKRSFDISNVQMHGSTSLLTAGPETSNYERKSDGSVFPSKLKIEIPSEVVKTHKVLLSWTIGPYRASVNENSNDVPSHDHSGSAGSGGAIDSDFTGADGGFTPDIQLDGLHTPAMIGGTHKHKLKGAVSYVFDTLTCRGVTSDAIAGGSHRHSGGGTGYSNDNAAALIPPLYMGSTCANGRCVTGVYDSSFATDDHYHQNSATGYTTPSMTIYVTHEAEFVVGVQFIEVDIYSELEDPVHEHTGAEVDKHDHAGVAEDDHLHGTPAVVGHTDHGITAESGYSVGTNYGIHEEAAGTVLELFVNSEKIGEYSGAQTEIRIDGYLQSGSNIIEIQPIAVETNKKGSTTISGAGIMFIEPKKF